MAKRRRRKIKRGFWYFLMVVVAALAIVGGFLYGMFSSDKDVMSPTVKNGKQVVSLLEESTEAQRSLDNVLLKQTNWQLVEKGHGISEIKVPENGATVEINQRYLGVGVPEDVNVIDSATWLKKKIVDSGLVYLGGEEALYNDKYYGYKCQIGIAVKSGEGKKNFPVDTVHFFNNLNLKHESEVQTQQQAAAPAEQQRHFEGRLAIIVDDCGTDIKLVRSLLEMDLPFNFSILPNKDFSSDILAAVNSKGRCALLHLPMEPLNRSAMSEGDNTIMEEMTAEQIENLTLKHLQGLYGVVGVNNHQGSRITALDAHMRAVLRVVRDQGLFFLDSKTNSATIARDVAREMGVKTCMNDIFLDNSTDPEAIREEVYSAMAMAEQMGSAIAICHARPNTVEMWKKYLNEFKATGITFVPVNELLY